MLRILWLQASGCGGETVSLLGAEQPDFLTLFDSLKIELVWHSAFSTLQGEAALDLFERFESGAEPLDVFVVEGAVSTSHRLRPADTGAHAKHILRRVRDVAAMARYTVAVGTCASFGGVVASGKNRIDMMGVQFARDRMGGVLGAEYRSREGLPVVNLPGCPAHPDWMTETFAALAGGRLAPSDLDRYNRPKAFYAKLAHHACPRNEYYEFKASALAYSQQGCLFENLGCKGTQCESDCNLRLWLSRTGSCPRGGFPCLSCTSPRFPDGFVPFFRTEKIGDIPTTLPLDVPKAWYVGISGLAKLACPERLRRNAVSFKHVEVPDEGKPQ